MSQKITNYYAGGCASDREITVDCRNAEHASERMWGVSLDKCVACDRFIRIENHRVLCRDEE